MRISDWSSDVCSSDLFDRNRNADIRAGEAEYPVLRPRRISCRKGHESLGICLNHKIVDGDLDRSAIIHPLPEFQHPLDINVRRQIEMRNRLFRFNERSEEHTSELQSLMRISYAVFCMKKNMTRKTTNKTHK